MERIFLEIPSLNRKQEALDYLAENIEYNSNLNDSGDLDLCLSEMTYEEWLLELKRREDGEYLRKINQLLLDKC